MRIIICKGSFILSLLISLCAVNLPAQQNDSFPTWDIDSVKVDKRTMVALTLGQSNAANRGQVPYACHNKNVFVYAQGRLMHARDPLPGATGTGGSVWSILGDVLIDSGLYEKIIIVPIAIGNTAISCWAHGNCLSKLTNSLKDLDSRKIRLTHIFWHQGESDNLNNTSANAYKNDLTVLLKILNAHQPTADLYISIASYHNQATAKPLGVDTTIRKAQKEFIAENKRVFYGPDTDELIYAIHRYDGVHFSEYGMKLFAARWLNAIREKKE